MLSWLRPYKRADDIVRERLQAGASFSGSERNHLFANLGGDQFADLSAISGLDSAADSRSFGLADFDHDGWSDIALVNSNKPQLELFRNNMGQQLPHRAVELRFVGGNKTPQPSTEWTNRDGFGARVEIDLGDESFFREHRAGEGFASQNSATMAIGIGERATVARARVGWPSGKETRLENLPAGHLVTIFENPEDGPGGSPVEIVAFEAPRPPSVAIASSDNKLRLALEQPSTSGARLRVFTTMATWCLPCRAEVPDLQDLARHFDDSVVELLAIPVDAEDTEAKLNDWIRDLDAPYRMLSVEEDLLEDVHQTIVKHLRREGIPATIITDAEGEVLLVKWGPPTLSELRQLLDSVPATDFADSQSTPAG